MVSKFTRTCFHRPIVIIVLYHLGARFGCIDNPLRIPSRIPIVDLRRFPNDRGPLFVAACKNGSMFGGVRIILGSMHS
jgi:hypothetical protein